MNITDPIYSDANKAREHLEKLQWPNGPLCPHCGNCDPARITKLAGKSTRPGVYKCKECAKPFSVTVGTVFERSHIPLNKWLLAVHLMAASKKGMSAHQLHRTLEVTYKTAWFMAHRIREAMKDDGSNGPLGGEGKIVEADETYIGNNKGSKRTFEFVNGKGFVARHTGGREKFKVVSLVERGGRAKSVVVDHITANAVRDIIVTNVDRKSDLRTDEANVYKKVGTEFSSHQAVNHSQFQWATGKDAHTNTIEGFFSIFKRGMKGIYQYCGEQHLHRYLAEFDFRYSNRAALGVDDNARANRMLVAIRGKRLTYRRSDEARHA
jgi:transposase-like protein